MRSFIFVALVPIMAAPAFAQDALQEKVFACANLAEAPARHACFDALVPDLKAAREAGFGIVANESKLTAPVASAQKPAASEQDRITLAIKEMSPGADGKMRFLMENGQIWRQTDGETVRSSANGPWTAEIRKASMGSFFLSVNGARSVRVRRMN